MERLKRALAIGICASLVVGAARAAAASTSDPVYNIPSGPQAAEPSLPLVAALMLPSGQTLVQVLRHGLGVRLTAYKPIHLAASATFPRATAKRMGLRPNRAIRLHRYSFTQPGVYVLRLRLTHGAVMKLRDRLRTHIVLRTTLASDVGRTTASSPISLAR